MLPLARADADGRSLPGQARSGSGSRCDDLASGRRGRRVKSGHPYQLRGHLPRWRCRLQQLHLSVARADDPGLLALARPRARAGRAVRYVTAPQSHASPMKRQNIRTAAGDAPDRNSLKSSSLLATGQRPATFIRLLPNPLAATRRGRAGSARPAATPGPCGKSRRRTRPRVPAQRSRGWTDPLPIIARIAPSSAAAASRRLQVPG
jgi:hypothetical protein